MEIGIILLADRGQEGQARQVLAAEDLEGCLDASRKRADEASDLLRKEGVEHLVIWEGGEQIMVVGARLVDRLHDQINQVIARGGDTLVITPGEM